jgi:MerR family redox-sensitive transcriptional activator SoxR
MVAVQVTDLPPADPERELAPPARSRRDARPGGDLLDDAPARSLLDRHDCLLASLVKLTRARLLVQVNLKSNPGFIPTVDVSNLLPIGEVARRSGVASSALRFYEQQGLISSERAGSGHRRYPRPVLRRIAFIVFAQRIGLTLAEIGAELAMLPPHGVPTRRDWSRLSATWSSRIDERIAELERLKLGLTECIGCGCLSLDRCRLANPRDRAAGLGPGPRFWIGDRPSD